MSKNIQWYPGHMAKAKREAQEKLKLVDIVIELVDARIPLSSRNPVIQEIIGHKASLIVLNKADMAEDYYTQLWLDYFKQNQLKALAIDAQHNKGIHQLKSVLKSMMADKFEENLSKGIKERAIRLMVLGIPNVGKSTLINRFVGKNQAITGNKPGVTKKQRWLKIGKDFELLDTPGILWPKFDDQETGIKLGLTGAIKDSLLYPDDLALYLLEILRDYKTKELMERYKLDSGFLQEASLVDLLMEICRFLGFRDDYDQASQRIIQDFRQLKFGPLTLDRSIHENS